MWRSLLSHSSNPKVVQIHFPLCQRATFKVGCVATPASLTSLCPFMLLGITVTSQQSCFMGHPWMSVPTDERKSRIVLLDLPLFPSSSVRYTPGTFSLHNTTNLSPHKAGAILITHGWALSLCPLCTARCRRIGLRLISTEAMSAVTWLQFILLPMAQITENSLYFQNEKYSRALINIQQGVPE